MSLTSDDYLDCMNSITNENYYKYDDIENNNLSLSFASSNNYNTCDNTIFIISSGGKTTGKKNYINDGNQNYTVQQLAKTKKEITDTITRSYISIPEGVIKATINLYHLGVQKNKITRADVKRGCQAACLYLMCREYGIPYKPKEIVKIFDISSPNLSDGINQVNELYNIGAIPEDIMKPARNRRDGFIDLYCFKELGIYDKETFQQKYAADCILIQNFLRRYFAILQLKIDCKSDIFQFSNVLAYFTMKFHICVKSNPSSCCAGILHIIALAFPHLGIINKIETCCVITKGTYLRFSNEILKLLYSKEHPRTRKKLNWIFHKYNIPKPYYKH